MKTTRFDVLRTSKPVNKTAGLVTSSGIHWNPNLKGNSHARKWADKPTDWLIPIPKSGHRATFEDLTDRKVGRFTVVGWLGKPGNRTNTHNRKSAWLVRCVCGNYETRSAKAIKAANPLAACEHCLYLRRVKEGRGNSPLAQAGEAGTAETQSGSVHEHAVRKDAPK